MNTDGEQEILLEAEAITIATGGAVSSVNGQTGDVVLTTSDLENTSDYQTGDEVTATVASAIEAETTARQDADSNLQGQIDAIDAVIPNQATASNQLADKDFVNSSVATNTAYYISDNGQPFTSVAALEAYSGTLTNNDYAFVTGTDAQGNTFYDRYKYNADTGEWAFEYELNNSSFTAVQWAAINSGITSGNVSKLNALANIQTIGANLALDANGELSATDTTYSDFTGTDGTTAGTAGLVPAPATTDAGKFLKADGTWEELDAGGGATELTADDYNWPVDNPTSVALWLLEPGTYYAKDGLQTRPSVRSASNQTLLAVIGEFDSTRKFILEMRTPFSGAKSARLVLTDMTTGEPLNNTYGSFLLDSNVVQATGTSTANVMSQKAVTDALNALPTGGATELTTADYNYPTNNPVSVALWTLEPGIYKADSGVNVNETTSQRYTDGCIVIVGGKNSSSSGVEIMTMPGNVSFGRMVQVSLPNGQYVSGGQVLDGSRITQSTGTSSSNIMSQNAVTSMVFADPGTNSQTRIGNTATVGNYGIKIGYGTGAVVNDGIALGRNASVGSNYGVALGYRASASNSGVALGADAQAAAGCVDVSSPSGDFGYNSSTYRKITGVYDAENAHDAVNLQQLTSRVLAGGTTAPTTATVGTVGALYAYVESGTGHLAICTDVTGSTYTWQTLV